MAWFVAALVLFIGAHVVPSIPRVRPSLIARLGRRSYIILYSAVSLVLLAGLIVATLRLDYVPLWGKAPWQAWVTIVLAPIGLFLVLAGLFSPNPMSISARRADRKAGAITSITRHPVLIGFMLWAGGHILPNGELRTLLLFGALFAFALIGIVAAERRARKRLGADWPAVAKGTSIVPFAALWTGRGRLSVDNVMVASLLATLLVTAWLLSGGHLTLFGADPLSLALG